MNVLRLRRFQGALFQGGLSAPAPFEVVDELLQSAAFVDTPWMPYMHMCRTRTLTSAALYADGQPGPEYTEEPVDRRLVQPATLFEKLDLDIPNLPTDINEIGRLNPELKEAMEAHDHQNRTSGASPRQDIEAFLRVANGGKTTKISKSALARLRVDQLRSLLSILTADDRGNKSTMVERLMALVSSGDIISTTTSIAASLGEGQVSRKALERAARLRARAGMSPSEFSTTDAALKEFQRSNIQAAAHFARVFDSPHDVTRLLIEARADDIAIIDVRGRCTFTDYMVLATGRSSQLVAMLAQAVLHQVKLRAKEVAPGVAPVVEGADDPNPRWLVVDAGSVVVHVFAEVARREYDLEGLWGTGNTVTRVAPRLGVTNTLETLRV